MQLRTVSIMTTVLVGVWCLHSVAEATGSPRTQQIPQRSSAHVSTGTTHRHPSGLAPVYHHRATSNRQLRTGQPHSSPHSPIIRRSRVRGSRSSTLRSSTVRTSGRSRGLRSLPRSAYGTGLRGSVEVDGRFLRPIDGDTFSYNGIKVRMAGLDAPEMGAPGGREAAQHLAAMLQEGQVTLVPRARDVYGRTVAEVWLNGQNLADRMIAEGFARRG